MKITHPKFANQSTDGASYVGIADALISRLKVENPVSSGKEVKSPVSSGMEVENPRDGGTYHREPDKRWYLPELDKRWYLREDL